MAEVYVRSWLHAYRGILPDSFLDSLSPSRFMLHFMKTDHASGLRHAVAESDGQIVGVLSYGPARDADLAEGWGEIVSVYLLPEYIGRGYGAVLLDFALRKLRSDGYTRCALWTLEENTRAQKAYERQGFRRDGKEKLLNFDGTGVTEVRYCRAL